MDALCAPYADATDYGGLLNRNLTQLEIGRLAHLSRTAFHYSAGLLHSD